MLSIIELTHDKPAKVVQKSCNYMQFQIGDILSIELVAHTRHFFVYIGNGNVIEWGLLDGVSWIGSKGHVFQKKLCKVGLDYRYQSNDGEIKEITLEKHTGVDQKLINQQVQQMTTDIDYHLGHRNCEHFAYYVAGHTARSEQSIWHLFTDHEPFTIRPMIQNFDQLREALLRCKFCGLVGLSQDDFRQAVLVNQLQNGYYVYHLSHPSGGQHLYVTSNAKSEDLESSYNSILLAYFGAFFGRGEILSIVRQLRGC